LIRTCTPQCKTAPSVFAALHVTLRRLGGASTYVLTDNEKTVTVEHVAGMAVRNPATVGFARHYGVTVHTCEPADPASKGGSESTVKLAKADLVPKDTNLLAEYASFAELEAACELFCEGVNARTHRVTRRGLRSRCSPRNAAGCTSCRRRRTRSRSG
jgi:transposase